ncbi:MAG: HEAT repeat domain-containing protein [Planctomycetota bacterium]
MSAALADLQDAASVLQAGEGAGGEESVWLENMAVLAESVPEAGAERDQFLDLLALAILQHPSPAVRCGALRVMAQLGTDDRIAALLRAGLDDSHESVRTTAAEHGISAGGIELLPDYAQLLLRNGSPRERLAALQAMAEVSDRLEPGSEALRAVFDCIRDPDPGVSFHARRILARRIGLPEENPGSVDFWLVWWQREGLQ